MNVVKRLFKIQNLNASTIRTVMVADCSRFDSPDLLLEAGDSAQAPCRTFDLGSEEDEDDDEQEQEEASGPSPARAKEGLRRLLHGILDSHVQPPLSERELETKVAELLARGRTKPPERGAAGTLNKLLIFTTGCLTYSPHQIGTNGWKGGESRGGGKSQRASPSHRHQADPAAPDDDSRARAGRGPGLRRLLRCTGPRH